MRKKLGLKFEDENVESSYMKRRVQQKIPLAGVNVANLM